MAPSPSIDQKKASLHARRTLLLARIATYLAELEGSGNSAAQIDKDYASILTRIASFTHADHAVLGHELAYLQDIDSALARIANGTYGICRRCGNPIEPRRLAAVPAAQTCSSCKAAFEKSRGIVYDKI